MIVLNNSRLSFFGICIFFFIQCSRPNNQKNKTEKNQESTTTISDSLTRQKNQHIFNLGSTQCELNCSISSNEFAVFLSIHDDENTAVEAFNAIIDQCPKFSLMELNQSGGRLIQYELNGKSYLVDPNRIFSQEGLISSLKKYNKNYPEEVISGFSKFATEFLSKVLPKTRKTYLIAAHNNTEGNLSINTYKGSPVAKEIYSNPSMDIDDFLYVTDQEDFNYFKSKKYNVVLQANSIPDDGSLSVYCQKNNIPYINIESQDGHLEIQKKMIIDTYNLIKTKKQ